MKKLILTALTVLMLTGSVWAQALTAYEQKQVDIYLGFLKDYGYSYYSNWVNRPNNKQKLEGVKNAYHDVVSEEAYGRLSLSGMMGNDLMARNAALSSPLLNRSDIVEKDLERAKSLMNSAEKAEEKKREAEEKKEEDKEKLKKTFLYSEVFSYVPQTMPQKGQFESTDDFNKRLNSFLNDSTNYYFEKLAQENTEMIMKYVLGNYCYKYSRYGSKKILNSNSCKSHIFLEFEPQNYNADKHIWKVKGGIRSVEGGDNYFADGIISIPPDAAQIFSKNPSTFSINPEDIYHVNYVLYPSKMTIECISPPNSNGETLALRAEIDFPRKQGGQDIVFKGSELWTDNPKAKTLVLNYKDIVKKIYAKQQEEAKIAAEKTRVQDSISKELAIIQAEQLRIAEEQAKIEEQKRIENVKKQNAIAMEQWGEKIQRAGGWNLVFKSPDGKTVKVEGGEPFPDFPRAKSYEINGKNVKFEKTDKEYVCYINGVKVYAWVVNGKNVISKRFYNTDYNSSALFSAEKGYLGYGVFDVE